MNVSNSSRSFVWFAMAVLALLTFGVADASAYNRFQDGCGTCHTTFAGFGASHGSHMTMAGSNCNLCHNAGDSPVIGLDPTSDRGCVGCHGREEDAGHDGPFAGLGAGLRQHHTNSGITGCTMCHTDADPANYTPVGEDVFPPFYGTVAGVVPDDPATDGLDNDGDLLYDGDDPDNNPANLEPIADANGPYSGDAGVPIEFDGSGSGDDGEIVSYEWDFGDGETGTGETTFHIYATAGNYEVTLTVTDDGGLTDTDETTADITAPANLPPVVDIGGPYEALVGEQVNFDLSGTTDPEGDNIVFMWLKWGEDLPITTPIFGPTASHTYTEPGEYVAQVSVVDNVPGHIPAIVDVPVTITDAPPPPEGNTWSVRLLLVGGEFTVEFEEFAGFLLVQTTHADGQHSLGIGMEFDGVIFWMDVSGAIFFGNIDHDAGTMMGIVFGYLGTSSIFLAEQI